ncbi:MAG: hypothetical protein RLZZ332_551 [Actinomycetota bacterium]
MQRRAVFFNETPLAANAVVPELGESLSHLDTDAVHDKILLILVLAEQLCGSITDLGAHRDDVECRIVDLAAFDRAEEVGDTQERCLVLSRIRKPHAFGGARLIGPDDDVIAVTVGREVAIHQLRHENAARLGLRELCA